MTVPNSRVILFNVAAGVVTVAALAAVVRSLLVTSSASPCSERYNTGTILSFERGGVLLTSADLQARLGGKDVGLDDNIQIARVKGGPSPVAMGVTLAKGSASPHGADAVKGGVSFPWEPRSVRGKTAACLAYNILLPADFDFHRGGVLPGLRGEESEDTPDSFATRLTWRSGGSGGVSNTYLTSSNLRSGEIPADPFLLPTGRWIRLEEEVVLNAPGEANGLLRVWVDGSMVVQYDDMIYRTRKEVAINGVAVDVHYGNEDPATGAPKDATVWFSPFEVRWQ